MALEMEMKSIELLLIGLGVPYESHADGDVLFVSNPKNGSRSGTIVNAHTHIECTSANDGQTLNLSAKQVIEKLYLWHSTL